MWDVARTCFFLLKVCFDPYDVFDLMDLSPDEGPEVFVRSCDLEACLEFFDSVVDVAAVCEDSLKSFAREGVCEGRDLPSLRCL